MTKKRKEKIANSIAITILLGFCAVYVYVNKVLLETTEIYKTDSVDYGKTLVWTIFNLGGITLFFEVHLILTVFATIGLIINSMVAVFIGKFGNGYFIEMLPGYLAWVLYFVISKFQSDK